VKVNEHRLEDKRPMRKLIQLIALGVVVATLALPALAQEATASPSPTTTTTQTSTAAQDDAEAKAALYKRVTDNYKTNQPVAYEAAKEYLQKYPKDDPKIIQYLQNFVAKYEKATVQNQFPQFIKEKKYTEAFALGKQILAKEPENLGVMMNLGYAGYLASFANNTAFNADAINYAKQAIQMIESGKTTDNWDPFKNKDEALAYLNYALGFMYLKNNPAEAVTSFIKAAQFNSPVKSEAITYYYLAFGYEAGPYKTQSDQFRTYEGKDETPESKAALESLNQVTDRLIDAYARAVSYAGTDAKYQADKTKWMARLTELYKFRHNGSDAGLNEMIASVRNTPLPTAAASAPTATTPATTTPASTTNTSGTDGTATSTTPATDAGTSTTTPTTTPANTAQPSSTTTPSTSTQPTGKPTTTSPAPSQPATKTKP
jgi:tetratricopeptide (TPR) repeat protein